MRWDDGSGLYDLPFPGVEIIEKQSKVYYVEPYDLPLGMIWYKGLKIMDFMGFMGFQDFMDLMHLFWNSLSEVDDFFDMPCIGMYVSKSVWEDVGMWVCMYTE